MKKQTPSFNKGIRKDIALIFSCPGKKEECEKKPVAGKTGENLEFLLECLKEKKIISSFNCRYDFRITNASKTIHYKAKTNRTEELNSVLLKDNNLLRLYIDICDIEKYVICFGRKAKLTHKKMLLSPKYKGKYKSIYIRHLGLNSLNHIKLFRKSDNHTEARLALLAKEIIENA